MDNRNETPEAEEKVKKRRKLVSNLLMGFSVVCGTLGVWLLLKEYVIMPNTDYVAPPTPTARVETPAPTLAPEATPSPTPEPTPYSLLPVELYFPTFEQRCEIQPVGKVDPETKEEVGPYEDGAMGTIDSNVISAWYKYGPSPGDRGNAILNGHKSWKGEKGVFSKLKDMVVGDQVVVRMDDGSYLYWYVDTVTVYSRTEVPASVMDLHLGEEPMLTLISCTGSWDVAAGTSSQRSVVVCKLADF